MRIRRITQSVMALGFLILGSEVTRADAELQNALREVRCLTEVIYHEARSEVVVGQIMVGMVVLARAADPEYPKSICKVIEEKNAFSYKQDLKLLSKPIEPEAWEKAYEIARRILREAWTVQFFPPGAGCVRMYKVSDDKLATLKKKGEKQLLIGKRKKGLTFFQKHLNPVFTIGSHTFYEPKRGCRNPMPTII
jgi:Cell Wall Hydrolase